MTNTLFCERPACVRPAEVKGFCRSHYQILRKSERARLGPVSRECLTCGATITTTDPRKLYCSSTCKDRGSYLAKWGRIKESRPARSCVACGNPLPSDARGGRMYCSDGCAQRVHKASLLARRRDARWADKPPCRICGAEIPRERTARAVYCSDACRSVAVKAARPVGYMRQRNYGITQEQFESMLAAQGNRCAICRTDTPGGKGTWHVDHDHETKAVRGLLCHNCNLMLGNAKDDPDRLLAAVEYLRTT